MLINSQSAYCPLIWMFHNRTLNNRINKLQERALRLVHNDNTSCFYESLQKDYFFIIHHRNIQKLAFEMNWVKHLIAPKIMCKLFNEVNVPYNLQQNASFRSYNVKTVLYGSCHISDLKFGIWFFLISEIARQNKFFAKRLKNGNQIDVHVGSAKFTFPFRIHWLKIALRRLHMPTEMSLIYRLRILRHIFEIYVYVYKQLSFSLILW